MLTAPDFEAAQILRDWACELFDATRDGEEVTADTNAWSELRDHFFVCYGTHYLHTLYGFEDE